MFPMYPMFPIYPFLPNNCEKPPTLYSIMDAMANNDPTNHISVENLSEACHSQIFNFDYPLSSKVNKTEFECMILDNFIMRRIGYETYTAFHIALKVKICSIMLNYNLLFDDLIGWDLFSNGEVITRNVTDSRSTQNATSLSSSTTASDTSDRRYSDLPNNQITNVQDGTYLTDYNYDTNTGTASATSNGTNNTNDSGTLQETTTRSTDDEKQINIYKKFLEAKQDIYAMIFKDLDVLFYQTD